MTHQVKKFTFSVVNVFIVLALILGILNINLPSVTAQQDEPVPVDPAGAEPDQVKPIYPLEPIKPLPSDYKIEQNADPYLHSLALGNEKPVSQYGPARNDPDQGIPKHAYSPFDDPEKREVCPPGGCDFVAGRVLIKFKPDQALIKSGTTGFLPQNSTLESALNEAGIVSMQPLFPTAQKPAADAMIQTVDGALIPEPDLTRWYQAQTTSSEILGATIEQLQDTDGIAYAEPDYIRKPIGEMSEAVQLSSSTAVQAPLALPGSTTDPLYDQQWHLAATHVPEAWAYLESQGLPAGGSRDVIVAVIDTGVDYTHPDLAANIWVNPAEFNGVTGVDDDGNGYVDDIHGADTVYPDGNPMDDHGHGTHVAGIIAAQANNGIGGVGVAYNVQVMPIKAAQYSGVLASSDIAEAIYYAVAKGADVINMSFGGYARSLVEEDALEVAFGQAVLVAAAGNDNKSNHFSFECKYGQPMYPAAYNWVLGVMASNKQGGKSFFSNFDCLSLDMEEYELSAPGEEIWSILPMSKYAAWSGTSMAAPIVSGIAALGRTLWSDKGTYSSRFIMGQIAGNTSQPIGGVTNALNVLTVSPKPDLNYLEHWLFDTQEINPVNDEDGIVDSGETVDLAIVIRNQWGKADNVTVTLEPLAEGAVTPDPYVTMLSSSVSYGAVGSFNSDDNGFIIDTEGNIIGVQNPFRFLISTDAPNDHVVPFRITIVAENGFNPSDPNSPYTFISYFYIIIQKGTVLPAYISNNLTLDNTNLWIIDKPVLIPSGVTLSITPGAQIQFWSSESDYPYGELLTPYLQVEGNFNAEGTFLNPIEIFPSIHFKNKNAIFRIQTEMTNVNFSYVNYLNPFFQSGSGAAKTDLIDHSYFNITEEALYFMISANAIANSRFDSNRQSFPLFEYPSCDTCLFNNIKTQSGQPYIKNSVLLVNFSEYWTNTQTRFLNQGSSFYEPDYLVTLCPIQFNGHSYFLSSSLGNNGAFDFHHTESWANFLGGNITTISDENENHFIKDYFLDNFYYWDQLGHTPCSGCPGVNCSSLTKNHVYYLSPNIGIFRNPEGIYEWISGATEIYNNWDVGEPLNDYSVIDPTSGKWKTWSWTDITSPQKNFIFETADILTQEQIDSSRDVFINNHLYDPTEHSFGHNAILNRWWDPNPNHWLRFLFDTKQISDYLIRRETIYNLSHNFWGDASDVMIDAAIYDNKDDFNLAKVVYKPILSDPADLESTYPFVLNITLSTNSDPFASEVGAEPVTFTVIFNRDMDQTVQPMVSFGPDVPMTDYTVHPIDGGWQDARTWAGTFNISPITGDGYQLIRVAGAVTAEDPWLVTGDDAGRFRFEVITSGTEAMNLQATGGEGYVDLMWTQTDFDLLSGFHLYRSTTLDGTYTRSNPSIIPPDVRNYRDTNVTPGQQYFYKFTVVKSDMTESDFSNVASAIPLDTIPPVLTHTIVTSAEPGLPLTLTATATDNVSVTGVTLYYRHTGDTPYLSKPMVKTTGSSYYASIEGSLLTSPGIEYYIEATDGVSVARSGRAETPNPVTVVDKPVLTIVTPNSGPSAGGTAVTLSGSNFKSGATVTFGGAAASNVVVVSSNQITCTAPAHIPETVDVRVTNPDAQYGVLLLGFTFVSTAAQVSLPTTGGCTGNVLTVPVNAGNLQGLVAASVTFTFDPAVLTAKSASTGSLTSGWSLASNLTIPGQARLSMISPSGGVSGAGTLANIEFEVVGAPGSSSALTLSNVLLNDGAITVELTAGSFSVDNVYNVSGLVSFWNGGAALPNALLTLSGDKVYNAFSGLDGNYIVQGAAIDAYVLTPSKSDGDTGIGAYDASLALQHDVGLITLSGYAATAADVNSNGFITAMDAYYILQNSVGLLALPFPGSGVVWKFSPVDRNIAMLTGHLTGQNFTGILLGDISGNWENPVTGLSFSSITHEGITPDAASAVLSMPAVSVLPTGTVDVPVMLDITDAGLYGADLTFTYDPAHIGISNVRVGSLATGWSLVSNLTESGVVRIAMAGANAITTDGQLVIFTVSPLGPAGTQSSLTITRGDLNEGGIPSTLTTGSVRISVPVTAQFSATLTSGVAPLSVSFTNLSTGDWTTSSWSFGDGATSNLNNPTHQYIIGGTYIVSLTVSGPGGTDIETKTGYITVYEPVSASFSATPLSGVAPLEVTFTNLSTGDWTTSSWDFGDGTTSTVANPTHTYTTAGVYPVSLTVSGPGGTDTETKTDYITVYEPVMAQFSATPTSGVAPLEVAFANLSTGDWTSSSWSFGDSATSITPNPTHTYTQAGAYTVSLTVSGPGGTDTETKTGYIQVSTLNVSGKVLYWSGLKAVENATLDLIGGSTYSDNTDSTGSYEITGIPAGGYTLTPDKSDEINGITAYDASLVLRHAAGLELLSGYPAVAADMNRSDDISSYDASLILQKAVGLVPEGFTETTQMWYFDPAQRSYASLNTNQVNQDFTAVLLGDPTGNWVKGTQSATGEAALASALLTMEATPPDSSGNVIATIYLDPNSTDVFALDLALQYDPSHAEIVSVTKGDLGDGWLLAENTGEPGVLRLALADTAKLNVKSAMAMVEFHLKNIYRRSEIIPSSGAVNEGLIPVDLSGTSIGSEEESPYSPAIGEKLTVSKVTFSWDAISDAVNYKLQLSTKPDFSVILLNVKTPETSYFFDSYLTFDKTYYWRVRPIYADSKGEWSTMSFESMDPLLAPVLDQPSVKQIITNTKVPLFTWFSVDNAKYYKIQISNSNTFLIKLQQSKEFDLDYQALKLKNGTYYWRVRAFDQYGAKGPWSEVRKFKIAVP